MKYCPNCGTAAEDMQAYCVNCGCKLPDKVENTNNNIDNSSQNTNNNIDNSSQKPNVNIDNSKKKFAAGIGIGVLAAIIGIVLVTGVIKSLTGKPSDTPKPEPSSGPSQETDADEAEKTPSLKQGIIEGSNSFVYNGQLVFFCMDNSIWSALIADDGSLYDFEETAKLPYTANSVAIVGTDLIAGTSDGTYKADLKDYEAGSGKLEKIVDNDIDKFSVYENYLYFGYGYTLYRVSLQGEAKLEVADEITDYQVTTQGIFYTGKEDGTLYKADFDGTGKESLLTAPYELYLSAGKDSVYCRHDGSQEITMYTASSDNLEEITLPGWPGKYSSINALCETGSGLVYEGKDRKACRYDLRTGKENQIGDGLDMPPVEAAQADSLFYWTTKNEIHWCNMETGISGSLKPADIQNQGSAAQNGQNKASSTQNKKADTDGTTMISGTTTIKTDLFSVKVPESWSGKVCYQIYKRDYNEYSLNFYHAKSRNAGTGGYLFAISLYMDGTPLDFPSFEEMGRLIYKPAEVYNVVALYPTDVQYPTECQQEYTKLRGEIDSVISSFTVDSTYQFIGK